jgi:DNA-binding response OmpR family regulator
MLTMTASPPASVATKATILLIEDDPLIERTLRRVLEGCAYRVLSVTSGAEARQLLQTEQPDVIVLDLVLPDADGLVLITSLQALTRAAVLICSARDSLVNRVIGLKLGAADFVGKPFDVEELEARIEALLRRTRQQRQAQPDDEVRVGELVINPRRLQVSIAGQPLHLTPIEYRLLLTLASQPGQIFEREALISQVWGYADNAGACDHLVDVHVGRLRLKLRAAGPHAPALVTVRARGFMLVAATDEDDEASSDAAVTHS